MNALRSAWTLVVASLFFLGGSVSFLDGDTYTLGAWLFIIGSVGFLVHALAEAFAGRGRS